MGMRITGSGSTHGEERRVTLTFRGTDRDFIRLIDALEVIPGDVPEEICRQINYYGGSLVNVPDPRGTVCP